MPESDAPTTPAAADTAGGQVNPTAEQELGDGGKAALDAERKARTAAERASKEASKRIAELETRVKEFTDRDKSADDKAREARDALVREKDDAIRELELAQREVLRYRVGAAAGLTTDLIGRIQGDTEDAMTEDAKKLATLIADQGKPRKPAPDPTLGIPRDTGASTTEQFSASMSQLFS